jgi:hypothetical protein
MAIIICKLSQYVTDYLYIVIPASKTFEKALEDRSELMALDYLRMLQIAGFGVLAEASHRLKWLCEVLDEDSVRCSEFFLMRLQIARNGFGYLPRFNVVQSFNI